MLYDRLKSDKEKERTMPIKEQKAPYEDRIGPSELAELKFNFSRMVKNVRTTKKFEKTADPKPEYVQIFEQHQESPLETLRSPNEF